MKFNKEVIKKKIGDENLLKIRELRSRPRQIFLLIKNFHIDALLYYKHSSVFKKDSFPKLESLIILHYHSLEKGLLHDNIRYKFGKFTVKLLIVLLQKKEVLENRKNSQIKAAYLVLCSYYELHLKNSIDISDYFPNSIYTLFNEYNMESSLNFSSTIYNHGESYFEKSNKNFQDFSNSRSSVRNYTGALIGFSKIKDVIDLAKNAPSVCNRQPVKVYYIERKHLVDEVLEIQGGLKGYEENISELLIVTSDRSYFYTIGEKNQLYIDGGIFLMNLLYALHFFKIAACPANWGMTSDKDKKIAKLLNLPESEKVISLVSIGIPKNAFKTCLSLRRSTDEIIKIVN